MIRLTLVSIQLLTVVLPGQATAQPASPRHLRPSPLDSSLACIEALYRLPVLRHEGIDNRLRIAPCPASRAELSARLARDTLRLFDVGEFEFLMAARFLPPWSPDLSPYAPRMKWNSVRVKWRVEPTPGIPEAPEIARQILGQSRGLPLRTSDEAGPDGSVELALHVSLQIVGAATDSATTVLALVDGLPETSSARVVLGGWRQGHFALQWDSPLLRAGTMYQMDVDGDGRPEIVVESTTSGNQTYPILVILDRQGRELTRQAECETLGEGFDALDGVCAIRGSDISFSSNETGPKEIRVAGWSGDSKDHLFRLKDGKYVAGRP